MISKWKVVVFDTDELFNRDLFDFLTEFVSPSELIRAAMMYYYHDESFFLDELAEDYNIDRMIDLGYDESDAEEMSKTVEEAISLWLEGFYPQFIRLFDKLRKQKIYLFHKVRYSDRHDNIVFVFRRKRPDERFLPLY